MEQESRLYILDMLKGIAIIGVVFFHANLFSYGYLGVDVYLVIAGYFTTKSIVRQFDNGGFSYLNFLEGRLVRLYPLLIIISIISLLLGYFTMLPTNYKNTAETVVGTSLFVNNIVQYITASDYWDASNEYKPLMHTWYIGVVFQFYVLYPLFFIGAYHFTKKWKRVVGVLLAIAGLASLLLYVLPIFDTAFHFYLLPSRFFEFIAGGLLVLVPTGEGEKREWKFWFGLFLIICLIVCNSNLTSEQYRLLSTVLFTTLLIRISTDKEKLMSIPNLKFISILGIGSYSIYIWHQVIIAFYRNIFEDYLNIWQYVFVIGFSLVVGIASYYLIEQTIDKFIKRTSKAKVFILTISCMIALPMSYISFDFYKRAGVVRDIPELETEVSKPETWETLVYNDNVYKYDVDFPNNGKKNVLVVGDSYARDWYNILKESHYANSLNLSYHKSLDDVLYDRIRKANYIFLANHGDFNLFDSYIPQMSHKELYRVGDKRFFSSPCLIYNRRFLGDSYYNQKVDITDDIANRNIKEKQIFGDGFINMMDVIKDNSGQYCIFTPEHKLISHDGLHLTRAGAKYYASKINFLSLFHGVQ